MEKRVIQTEKAPAAIGPYSQAIAAGPWVFVSGQIGLKPDTNALASPGLPSQARQALENVKAILEAAGCSLKDVVTVEVYLTDISNFALFNGIYEQYFTDHRPARAAIGVNALPKGAFVEIKCIALKPDK